MDLKIIGPNESSASGVVVDVVQPIMGMSPEEFAVLTRSMLVVIPYRPMEGICGDLAQTIGFWAIHGTPVAVLADPFGGFIELTRAGIVKTFLQYCNDHPEIDKLVMIDADENVPWDAPYRLAQWDRPVVSGVVCTSNPTRGVFACFTMKDAYGAARFPSLNFTRKMPARGLKQVHSVGTGLICIKKEVLRSIVDSGETPFIIQNSVRLQSIESGMLKEGEDIAFCRQAEARGYGIFVDLSVHASHFKLLPVTWPRSAIDYDLDAADWQVNDKDFAHG